MFCSLSKVTVNNFVSHFYSCPLPFRVYVALNFSSNNCDAVSGLPCSHEVEPKHTGTSISFLGSLRAWQAPLAAIIRSKSDHGPHPACSWNKLQHDTPQQLDQPTVFQTECVGEINREIRPKISGRTTWGGGGGERRCRTFGQCMNFLVVKQN